jgi:hypothetical protein
MFLLAVCDRPGLRDLVGWVRPLQVHGLRCLSPIRPMLSRKVCYTVSEFCLAQEASDYRDGVDYAENQARVYTSVPKALPSQPAIGKHGFHPAVQAFNFSPEHLRVVYRMFRTLHVNSIITESTSKGSSRPFSRLQGTKPLIFLAFKASKICSDANWLSPAKSSRVVTCTSCSKAVT